MDNAATANTGAMKYAGMVQDAEDDALMAARGRGEHSLRGCEDDGRRGQTGSE